MKSDADQEVVNAIKMGESRNSVSIEGDATALLASAPAVAQWNAKKAPVAYYHLLGVLE